jgi:KaiC/GvpD/RAD55 family RecA-like ATPase
VNATPPIRFLDVASMAATAPQPVPWLAPPVLPRGTLTALYAPGGDGKSLLSMALAAAIAHGSELAGIECEHGVTIYLDAENGEREIHRRVHTLGLPSSGVRMADASGLDLRRDISAVEAVVNDTNPDLLVLDSFRSMTPGMDENDTGQTARALDPLRRLAHESETAILLIHHANKAGRDFRGASSIRDSVDVLWHLGRREDDPDQHRRFLGCRKMRVAAEPERLWLRLAIDRGRVLIDQAEPPEEQATSAAQPVRAMLSDQILNRMGQQPLRLAQIAELVGRRPKDGSVRNALSALVADGLLTRQGNEYLKVQTVQADELHPCTEPGDEVQSSTTLKGAAPLHPQDGALDADAELARLSAKGLAG